MFHQSSRSRQNKSKMQVDVKATIQTPRTHQVPSEINKGRSTWFQTCKGKEEIQNCSGKKKIFSLVRRESLTDSDFSSAPESWKMVVQDLKVLLQMLLVESLSTIHPSVKHRGKDRGLWIHSESAICDVCNKMKISGKFPRIRESCFFLPSF